VCSQDADWAGQSPNLKKKEDTMRNIRTIAGVVLMLGFVVGSTYGQGGAPKMKVTVPFQFSIGRTTLSAGQYLITSLHDRVLVQEGSGRNSALTFTGTLDGKVSKRNSRVIFDCYFGECFLSQVWFSGQEAGHTLSQSKRQVELARKGAGQQFALLGTTKP
jgi:hypothetical protein